MSNTPLPEPDGSAEANQRPHPGGGYEYDEVPAWSGPLVRAHAAAVSAAKDARIKVLEEQLAVAAMQLINAIGYIEEARAALGDSTSTTQPPSPSPRS